MTRAGIKLIKDREEDLYFYTHCDGYPTAILVDIIHMKNKDSYDDFVHELSCKYEDVGKFPSDIKYGYIIDWDNKMIETYSGDRDIPCRAGLLRKDPLYTDVLEIED